MEFMEVRGRLIPFLCVLGDLGVVIMQLFVYLSEMNMPKLLCLFTHLQNPLESKFVVIEYRRRSLHVFYLGLGGSKFSTNLRFISPDIWGSYIDANT